MSRALVKNLISSGEFYVSNKALIRTIGPLETLVLSVLSDSETLHYTEDGWFYATAEYVQEEVNIGRKPFDACIKKLKDIGVIDTMLKGLPAKSHYKLCYDKIAEIITNYIVQKEQSSLSKTDNLGCPNGTTINNLYNKESIKKESINNRKIKKELDLSFVSIHFEDVFNKWLRYKKEKKQPYTQSGAEACYHKLIELSNNDPSTADKIVEQSMANNYQGLFALSNNGHSKQQTMSVGDALNCYLESVGFRG